MRAAAYADQAAASPPRVTTAYLEQPGQRAGWRALDAGPHGQSRSLSSRVETCATWRSRSRVSAKSTALTQPDRTRTTRLAARSGRLHRPGDPRAGPGDADVTGRATALRRASDCCFARGNQRPDRTHSRRALARSLPPQRRRRAGYAYATKGALCRTRLRQLLRAKRSSARSVAEWITPQTAVSIKPQARTPGQDLLASARAAHYPDGSASLGGLRSADDHHVAIRMMRDIIWHRA